MSHLGTYSVQDCDNLTTVTLNNVESLDTYSLDANKNIETLILPRANYFKTYFADTLTNLKHLFLTAPGDFHLETYSFLALTKDVRKANWSADWEYVNKDVTLYLNRDKLSSAYPQIISPTQWGELFPNKSRNEYYRWKAIYICDDYATDISKCELVK